MKLSAEEQADRLILAQQGNKKAFDELYLSIDYLVRKLVSDWANRKGIDSEEAIAEARLIALESLLKWEPSRGKLTTFVGFRIKKLLGRRLLSMRQAVDIPYYAPQKTVSSIHGEETTLDIPQPEQTTEKRTFCLVDLEKYLKRGYRTQYKTGILWFPKLDKKIFILRFGFLGHRKHSPEELAELYQIPVSEVYQACRTIAKMASRRKKCVWCKQYFIAWQPKAKYCSVRCSGRAVRDKTPPVFTCLVCKEKFTPASRTSWRDRVPIKYCGNRCRNQMKVEKARQRKSAPPEPKMICTFCRCCGEPFPFVINRVYCSKDCRIRSSRRPLNPKHCATCAVSFKPHTRNQKYCGVNCRPYLKKQPPKHKICLYCEKPFFPKSKSSRASTCSENCRHQRTLFLRRAKRENAIHAESHVVY